MDNFLVIANIVSIVILVVMYKCKKKNNDTVEKSE